MVSEIITALAVSAAALGAGASTVQGYLAQKDSYSIKKLGAALIGSVLSAFGLVNLSASALSDQVTALGLVGLFITNVLVGYGIDKAISKGKK